AMTGVETGREQAARRHAAATAAQRHARFWRGKAIVVHASDGTRRAICQRIELIDLMKRRAVRPRRQCSSAEPPLPRTGQGGADPLVRKPTPWSAARVGKRPGGPSAY